MPERLWPLKINALAVLVSAQSMPASPWVPMPRAETPGGVAGRGGRRLALSHSSQRKHGSSRGASAGHPLTFRGQPSVEPPQRRLNRGRCHLPHKNLEYERCQFFPNRYTGLMQFHPHHSKMPVTKEGKARPLVGMLQ